MSAIRITNFSMRPAVSSDIQIILLLLELDLGGTALKDMERQFILDRAKYVLKSIILEERSYIACIEDDIIGFGGWTTKTDLIPMPLIENDNGMMFLLVHPRWRRRGVGKQLIKVCELTARQSAIRAILMLIPPDARGVARSVQYTWLNDMDIPIHDEKSLQLSWYKKSLI